MLLFRKLPFYFWQGTRNVQKSTKHPKDRVILTSFSVLLIEYSHMLTDSPFHRPCVCNIKVKAYLWNIWVAMVWGMKTCNKIKKKFNVHFIWLEVSEVPPFNSYKIHRAENYDMHSSIQWAKWIPQSHIVQFWFQTMCRVMFCVHHTINAVAK